MPFYIFSVKTENQIAIYIQANKKVGDQCHKVFTREHEGLAGSMYYFVVAGIFPFSQTTCLESANHIYDRLNGNYLFATRVVIR